MRAILFTSLLGASLMMSALPAYAQEGVHEKKQQIIIKKKTAKTEAKAQTRLNFDFNVRENKQDPLLKAAAKLSQKASHLAASGHAKEAAKLAAEAAALLQSYAAKSQHTDAHDVWIVEDRQHAHQDAQQQRRIEFHVQQDAVKAYKDALHKQHEALSLRGRVLDLQGRELEGLAGLVNIAELGELRDLNIELKSLPGLGKDHVMKFMGDGDMEGMHQMLLKMHDEDKEPGQNGAYMRLLPQIMPIPGIGGMEGKIEIRVRVNPDGEREEHIIRAINDEHEIHFGNEHKLLLSGDATRVTIYKSDGGDVQMWRDASELPEDMGLDEWAGKVLFLDGEDCDDCPDCDSSKKGTVGAWSTLPPAPLLPHASHAPRAPHASHAPKAEKKMRWLVAPKANADFLPEAIGEAKRAPTHPEGWGWTSKTKAAPKATNRVEVKAMIQEMRAEMKALREELAELRRGIDEDPLVRAEYQRRPV